MNKQQEEDILLRARLHHLAVNLYAERVLDNDELLLILGPNLYNAEISKKITDACDKIRVESTDVAKLSRITGLLVDFAKSNRVTLGISNLDYNPITLSLKPCLTQIGPWPRHSAITSSWIQA
jgi:hypothetical protein